VERLAVLDVVGLTRGLLARGMPQLAARAARDGLQSFRPAFPAVTSTVQASMLTGREVASHGVVGNGWYDRETGEVRFWRQSNALIHGEKVWDRLRREQAGIRCANLFWWFNMHSSVDLAVTPRPLYPADGRKVFDVHTQPMGLRVELKHQLGPFPFPSFWGPAAGIGSSEWIARAARWIDDLYAPELSLVYLPHLDYDLQRFGPAAAETGGALAAIDRVAGGLADYYESRNVQVIVVSEYGITAVSRPVHLNRVFRECGWLAIKDELGHDALIAGDSDVFAVADHQIAHIYVRDPARIGEVMGVVARVPGVAEVRSSSGLWGAGIAGRRSGDLVAVAEADAWFTYFFWDDDARAPDYARTVDIHRKPGYDPLELVLDPTLAHPRWRIARHLARVRCGLRSLLEIIPLDAALVRGSHGRDDATADDQPVIIGATTRVDRAEDVYGAIVAASRPAG
jgi:predicted AlkP superfamily pyrophosphatase or phosphodiesterase